MNKWMKQGLLGLAMSTAAVAAAATMQTESKEPAGQPALKASEEVMIDALDFAGGSKLKDRRVLQASAAQKFEIVLVDSQS